VLDVEELKAEKARFNEQVADIDELISDLKKATDLET